MEWKSAMQHSGASGRQAIFGPVRAAGSARCAFVAAWRVARLGGTTQRRGIDSRRELLDAQGGCGLRGGCFLVQMYLIQMYLNFLHPRGPAPVFFMSSYANFFFFSRVTVFLCHN